MKNYMYNARLFIISLSILHASATHAVVIGSNSAVSLQPAVTFPASDTDNTMLGFAWFKNGFTLEDATTSVTFDTVFPVSGTVDLNGGTLSLLSNLNCDSGVVFSGNSSVVNLNNRDCNFGQSDLLLWNDSTNWQGSGGALNFFSNVRLSNTWTFSGHCVITGNGHVLDISDGNIIVQPGSTLEFRNVRFKNISGNNISCVDDSGVIILDSVDWHQSSNVTFSHGSLQFKNEVNFMGDFICAYQSPEISTIFADTTVTFDSGFTFSYDPGTSPDLLTFVDHTSLIVLNDNATLFASQQGLNLLNGSMFIQANAFLISQVVGSVDNGITIGDCNPANDFNLTLAGNAVIAFAGSLNYKNINEASFTMQNATSAIYINDNSALNLYQNVSGQGSVFFGDNTILGTSPDVSLLINSNQLGALDFVTLPSC